VRVSVGEGVLVADLGSVHRCLSSAVLGGGLGAIRTWVNAQVPHDYARTDPDADLAARAAGLPGPVVGMLTAADVARHTRGARGGARALATVGVEWAFAAAGRRPSTCWW
jgi:adenosylcobinamide amidohydrolase